MSHLKNILVELQNCVGNEDHDAGRDLPLWWSKDFTKQIAQDADNYRASQRRISTVGDMEQDDNIPFRDNQDTMDQAEITYNDEENAGAEEEFDQNWLYAEEEEKRFVTGWGPAYQEYQNQESMDAGQGFDSHEDLQRAKDDDRRHELKGRNRHEENEEKKAQFSPSGMRSEYDDDCPDCFGTGADFPRLKGECKTCNGTGKAPKEEEQEFGGNEQEARRVRDKAVGVRDRAEGVRDKAIGVRDKAKKQNADEKDPTNMAVDDQYGLDDPNDQEDFGDAEGEMGSDEEWDDPDFQGSIRKVDNAHLVFKRQQEDGTFNELWQYNLGDDFKRELAIRRAIISGTDIPINKMRSPDNSQSYELWTVGNGQLLQIKGLPN